MAQVGRLGPKVGNHLALLCIHHMNQVNSRNDCRGAITSKIKHAIKLKTSPARLVQLLQLSLAICFSLQPVAEHHIACFILL